METPHRHDLSLVGTAALVVLVFAGDVATLAFSHDIAPLATWWTTVGIGLALLARNAVRRWPALVVVLFGVGFAARVLDDGTTAQAVRLASCHCLEAVVGALVFTLARRRPGLLEQPADLGRLVAAALSTATISAVFLHVFPSLPTELSAADTAALFVSRTTSVLVLATLLLVRPTVRRSTAVELGAQSLLMVGSVVLLFAPDTALPLTYLPIALLVWGALRLDLVVVAAQLAAFGATVSLLTTTDHGPFALMVTAQSGLLDERHTGLYVEGYVLCATLLTLPLALAMREKARLMARVVADEELFRRNYTDTPLGMLFLHRGPLGLVVDDVNPAGVRMLGASSADAVVGHDFADLVRTTERMACGPTPWRGQAVARARPESRLGVSITRLEAQADDGRGEVFSVQMLDISLEHQARRRLETAHKLNDATLDTAACIILVADVHGRIVRVNAATQDITGYAADDLVGRLLWRCGIDSLDQAEVEAMFVWPNRSGMPMTRERAMRTTDGRTLRIVWTHNVVRDQRGAPSYAVLTGIDVSVERSSTALAAHLLQAAISTAVVGIDVDGRVTVFNAGAERMLGYRSDEVVGTPFTRLLDPQRLAERTLTSDPDQAFRALVGTIGATNESLASDWTWRTRQGHPVLVSMTLSVSDPSVDDRIGFLAIGRDVTEQRAAQETLVAALEKERTAVDRLRSLDAAKDDFVSTVSHELRTPITSIIGYTEMLRDGSVVEPAPEQLAMLRTISRNGERLVAICNDLLMLSGFEQPILPAARQSVDLRSCLSLAEESARALLVGRQVRFTVDVPDHPACVLGDPAQLERAVLNLVSNAVKFTEDGGSVTVRAQALDGNVIVTVRDTGIGIARDELDSVFHRFYRATSAHERAIPGTGLGLPIVAGIVEAHGGRIEVDSELGVGTTFRVWLPEEAADAQVS